MRIANELKYIVAWLPHPCKNENIWHCGYYTHFTPFIDEIPIIGILI